MISFFHFVLSYKECDFEYILSQLKFYEEVLHEVIPGILLLIS